MLAGRPPHVGMYASLLGSSMTLPVGPVAVASLITASAVAPLAAADSKEYLLLATLLALIGGVVLLLLDLPRKLAHQPFLNLHEAAGALVSAASRQPASPLPETIPARRNA